MSFRLSSLGCCLSLLFFGGVSLFPTSARAQGESRPRRAIELSETNNTEVLSRLDQLTDKKEGFKELQDEWSKAFQSVTLESRTGDGSAPLQYTPPRPAPLSSKRMKDLLERKRNWMLTPEDLLPENSSDDGFSDSGSDPKRKDRNTSSLKQFSDALGRRDNGNSKLGNMKEDDESEFFKSPNTGGDPSLQDDPSLPTGIRNSAKNLRSWLGTETAQGALSPNQVRSSFEDFFGLGNADVSQEQAKAQRDYLDKYRTEVLGDSGLSPSVAVMNPILNPLGQAPFKAAYSGGLESVPSTLKPETLSPTPATGSSVLSPVGVADLNGKALNQWNPLYAPTVLEPPKATAPIFPSMEVPRRRF